MPVGLMLRSITSKELTEWMAFYSVNAKPKNKTKTSDVLKAMFAGKVVKKKK